MQNIYREIKEQELETELEIIKILLQKEPLKGIYSLSEWLIKKHKIITWKEQIYVYIPEEGIYSEREEWLKSYIQKELELQELVNNRKLLEIIEYIKRLTYTPDIEEEKELICLNNGILNIFSQQLIEHTPQKIFTTKIPVTYKPEADCPRIKKFFSEIVKEEDTPLLQEIAGYCLLKEYPIHKAFMLVGGGSNGKSTYLNLLKTFLGEKNCSHIPLQQLENSRFSTSQLHKKLVNIFADLSNKELKYTSYFKILTGEDTTNAERKFKEGFSFKNYAKLIFSCNEIPRSYDDSDAFFRRWIIINFPNTFPPNPKLLEELTTPEELSGFLNYALEGLRRILTNKKFSYSLETTDLRKEYRKLSDNVSAFTEECLVVDYESYVEKQVLYNAYVNFCKSIKSVPVSENFFHRRLKSLVNVYDYRPAKSSRCWKGIRLVEELNQQSAQSTLNSINDGHNGQNPYNPITPYQKAYLYSNNNNNIDNKIIRKQGYYGLDGKADIEKEEILEKTYKEAPRMSLPCNFCGLKPPEEGHIMLADGRPCCELCFEELFFDEYLELLKKNEK